jgi:hypothetical protein
MEQFCRESGYEARFVPVGFLPQSAEDRLLIAPPERNMDVHNWQEQARAADAVGADEAARRGSDRAVEARSSEAGPADTGAERPPLEPISSGDPELEAFRRQLEGLL